MSNHLEIHQYLLEWAVAHPVANPPALFSAYVRIARQKNQITREELSHQTQISVDALIAIENGLLDQADLPPDIISTLEQALHLSYQHFTHQYTEYLKHHAPNR